MDFYYRKRMGHGTVASKFRIHLKGPDGKSPPQYQLPTLPPLTDHVTKEGPFHASNCVRCYKLKKKCSRTYPRCSYCAKTGNTCEYVDRRKASNTESRQVPGILEGSSGLLIANLVNKDDTETPFTNIDLPSQVDSISSKEIVEPPRKKTALSLEKNVLALSMSLSTRQHLQDEFLVVRAISDPDLPLAFAHTYFANYEWKYPFLARGSFMTKLRELKFDADAMVSLEVYLVLAIGLIVFDTNNNTSHFLEFFSESLIESTVDMISFDIRLEKDIHTAHLLILLCIYGVNVSNANLVWNIVGFLNRLIIFLTDFIGASNQCMSKRCFWTVHNLDKEISLMLHKPSQFMPAPIIFLDTHFSDVLNEGESSGLANLMKLGTELHQFQDRMVLLRLGLTAVTKKSLTEFSADLEKWRVSISSAVHSEYAELPLLQNFIGLVNLDYYFLLIELDQLSLTELFQFTLQFLSNSFSLLLTESSEKKGVVGTLIYSLFWFAKFFKVIKYNLLSLARILTVSTSSTQAKAELNGRIAEFNSNLQLIINLLKFLISSKRVPETYQKTLKTCAGKLSAMNMKLSATSILLASDETLVALAADATSSAEPI